MAILSLGVTLVAVLIVAFEAAFPGLNLLLETHGYSGGSPGVAKQVLQAAAVAPLSDQSVIDLNHSPYAKLKGVPVRADSGWLLGTAPEGGVRKEHPEHSPAS